MSSPVLALLTGSARLRAPVLPRARDFPLCNAPLRAVLLRAVLHACGLGPLLVWPIAIGLVSAPRVAAIRGATRFAAASVVRAAVAFEAHPIAVIAAIIAIAATFHVPVVLPGSSLVIAAVPVPVLVGTLAAGVVVVAHVVVLVSLLIAGVRARLRPVAADYRNRR